MDTYIKEVVDYLLYIGILPKSAISNFSIVSLIENKKRIKMSARV